MIHYGYEYECHRVHRILMLKDLLDLIYEKERLVTVWIVFATTLPPNIC
jgi:hypothetical protein